MKRLGRVNKVAVVVAFVATVSAVVFAVRYILFAVKLNLDSKLKFEEVEF